MKYFLFSLSFLFFSDVAATAQQKYCISGDVYDTDNKPVPDANVFVNKISDSSISAYITDGKGYFKTSELSAGNYNLQVSFLGMKTYKTILKIKANEKYLGKIVLEQNSNALNEVKIISKVIAVAQKDDTLEFSSSAFKVNPDADALDLIRKMPTIDIGDKKITAQGEQVTKIVVDGKPFFGNDPYAALKNLPADIIDRVLVYNQKTDQEQFTGFSEGNTTKTVDIITKKDKKEGVFGKIYGGEGIDDYNSNKYSAGLLVNQFSGDKRITLTTQSNNVNNQNFSNDNTKSGGTAGLSNTNAGGINYSDKWSKKIDVNISYFLNNVHNSVSNGSRKTYMLAADSSQVYNEVSPSSNQNFSQRFNCYFNYAIDTMNSILLQPQLSLNKSNTNSLRIGNTTEGNTPLNQTNNFNLIGNTAFVFSNSFLFRHKFLKKGRTFSSSINTNNNSNNGSTVLTAQNVYYTNPALNDTIDQKTIEQQSTWNLTGNATYTEPAGKQGLLKLEYNVTYMPAVSERNTNDFSYAANAFSLPDNLYSNDFNSRNITHKAGTSYLLSLKEAEFSIGLNYQYTELSNEQEEPVSFRLNQDFKDLLPAASFHYKFSKTQYLQCTYNTSTQVPSVSQLQNVVNNTDPLHLYTGNPLLRQPYRHNLVLRYSTTSKNAKNSFSATIAGTITQHNITSNSIIAGGDTTIEQNLLAKGSQLTVPVNIEGYHSFNTNVSYGIPLDVIKCRLNFNINTILSRVPAIINNQVNNQYNKNGGVSFSLNSNISGKVDFSISSGLNVVSNANSINTQLNTTYINESNKAAINIIFPNNFVFNTNISYQANSGLSAGYDQSYALWDMSFGKKIFKGHKGDVRLSVFDILNQNNNTQHTVTDIYIQDTHSNVLQRYFLLVFTYKISEFKK